MLSAGQAEKIITALVKMKIITALVKIMKAVQDHRHEIVIDEKDLGTGYTIAEGAQPTLDDMLKRWNEDAVG